MDDEAKAMGLTDFEYTFQVYLALQVAISEVTEAANKQRLRH